MDYQFVIVFIVFASILKNRASAYFNQTFGIYSFVISDIAVHRETKLLGIATSWCHNNTNGYKLFTMPSKDILNFTQEFISSAFANGHLSSSDLILLNGLRNESSSWKWVNGKSFHADIADQSNSNNYNYGYLQTTDSKFHASSPNGPKPYICEFLGETNCTEGLALSGKCYRKYDTRLTWYSARNGCLDEGGDLASFENINSLDNLSSTIQTLLIPSGREYWIGLRQREWTWQDTGLPFGYSFWEGGVPFNGNDCLCLRSAMWLWYLYCPGPYRFICLATEATTASTTASETTSYSALSNTTSTVKKSENSTPAKLPVIGNSVALPVGLGVGLGIGAILIIAIVVIVVLLVKRRKQKNTTVTFSVMSPYENIPVEETVAPTSAELNTSSENKKTSHTDGATVYASVQPQSTVSASSPTTDAETRANRIIYADFNFVPEQ